MVTMADALARLDTRYLISLKVNSMKRLAILPLISLLSLAGACSAEKASSTYKNLCASCHGKNLQGASGSSLIDDTWTFGHTPEMLYDVISNGRKDVGMPSFKEALEPKQIRGLVIYMQEQKAKLAKAKNPSPLDAQSKHGSGAGHSFNIETVAQGDGVFWAVDFMPNGNLIVGAMDSELWLVDASGKFSRVTGTPKVYRTRQGGMLDVKLHPDYKDNGWVYISYSEDKGAKKNGRTAAMTAVVRGKIVDNKWVKQETIYSADDSLHLPTGQHFGSRFVFNNGYLYFSIGDRGRKELSQDLSKPNGKIFRLHDDGRIPKDNPFVNTTNALAQIWSYGHRNPQGLTINPATQEIWSTEHGPRGGDEVNIVHKGANYGWPVITYGMNYNGTPITEKTSMEGMEQPAHYWVPSIAVSGVAYVHASQFEKYNGKLLVSSLKSQELRLLTLEGTKVTNDELVLSDIGRMREAQVGPDGAIYIVVSDRSKEVSRIVRLTNNEQ